MYSVLFTSDVGEDFPILRLLRLTSFGGFVLFAPASSESVNSVYDTSKYSMNHWDSIIKHSSLEIS